MNNGTNPLFLIDELHSLGDCICVPITNKVPALEEFDPNKCYTTWEIFLATNSGINSITDVFIFVEDECLLQVNLIAEHNIINRPSFIELIDDLRKNQKEIGLSQLKDFVSTLSAPEIKQEKKGKEEKISLR